MNFLPFRASYSIIGIIGAMVTTAAMAQSDSSAGASSAHATNGDTGGIKDIIVTARRTNESSLKVPVVVSIVSGEALQQQNIRNLEGIAAQTPLLIVSNSPGAIGGSITLRGISSGDTSVGIDQAVSLNLDGVQVSTATAVLLGQHDLAQVEILKGPQSLFFGKNSTAGIISLVSNDPTKQWDSSISVGYETVASEKIAEGYISGPISDSAQIRLAGWYSNMLGYFTNPYNDSRVPHSEDFGGRLSLALQPTSNLQILAKFAYDHVSGTDSADGGQIMHCSNGIVPLSGVGDCQLNRTSVAFGPLTPTLIAAIDDPRVGNGDPVFTEKQAIGTLKAMYTPNDKITLTSLTGYYNIDLVDVGNTAFSPMPVLGAVSTFGRSDFSEEIRISSKFDGLLNFNAGAYYQDSHLRYQTPVGIFNFLLANNNFHLSGETYSAFGQVVVRPTSQLELDAGGRFTHERKAVDGLTAYPVGDVVSELSKRSIDANDFSPELTLSYHPTEHVTLFASYKRGFKSGGFNLSPAASAASFNGADLSFEPEKARGGEVGLKSLLFDRQLRFELAGYSYRYSNLQVSAFDSAALGLTTLNAATANTKGIEAQMQYEPRPVPGLSLNGSVAYTKARYTAFTTAGCYAGQTIALGCDGNLEGGAYTTQDLSGRPLPRSPQWGANFGISYDFAIAGPVKLGLGANGNYVAKYFAQAELTPSSIQNSYATLDARIRIHNDEKGWELALIGTNLTDKIVALSAIDIPGSPSFDPSVAKTGTAGPGVLADTLAQTNRARQILFRLTIKPGLLF